MPLLKRLFKTRGGVLSRKTIGRRLLDMSDDFKIAPILDWQLQIGPGAIDIRLGNEFLVTTRTEFAVLDPADGLKIRSALPQYQRRVRMPYGGNFVLHPNELVLGSSFEFLSFPADLLAYVVGRSSWGRLGLIIATAPIINPGFKGCITLELVNIGNVPIILYPFVRIAQLILHPVEGPEHYEGKYDIATGPEFSRIYTDPELESGLLRGDVKDERNHS